VPNIEVFKRVCYIASNEWIFVKDEFRWKWKEADVKYFNVDYYPTSRDRIKSRKTLVSITTVEPGTSRKFLAIQWRLSVSFRTFILAEERNNLYLLS